MRYLLSPIVYRLDRKTPIQGASPGHIVAEETTGFPLLLSGTTFILALVLFYVARALWIARREWGACRTDTKVLYLIVAPPLTLAVDLLAVTDRLFWSRRAATDRAHGASQTQKADPLRSKAALRQDS